MLPVRDDGTSRLEHFSSIRVGLKLKHMHVFGCPVFALQNELASGSSLPKWSPRARLGINLGPSPHHARNVSLVLNPHTGCVSPQFHCQFDDFFETVRHSGPDVSIPTTWQQLSGLICADNVASIEVHDDSPLPLQRMSFVQQQTPATDLSFLDVPLTIQSEDSQADLANDFSLFGPSDSLDTPVAPPKPLVPTGAGTSSRGRVCTMSRAMAESVSQHDFYGRGNMHYMAAKSVCEHDYSAEHNLHLELQERMRRPIAFLAEMMGDIMYLHQALCQPDSRKFVEAVIKEVNGLLSASTGLLSSEIPSLKTSRSCHPYGQ